MASKSKRVTRTQKVTMSLPVELVAMADLEAELLGLDRYDVIRSAIGFGLASLRAQRVLSENPEQYADALKALFAGKPEQLGEQLTEGSIQSYQRQIAAKQREEAEEK